MTREARNSATDSTAQTQPARLFEAFRSLLHHLAASLSTQPSFHPRSSHEINLSARRYEAAQRRGGRR